MEKERDGQREVCPGMAVGRFCVKRPKKEKKISLASPPCATSAFDGLVL